MTSERNEDSRDDRIPGDGGGEAPAREDGDVDVRTRVLGASRGVLTRGRRHQRGEPLDWARFTDHLAVRALVLMLLGFGLGYTVATRLVFPAPSAPDDLVEVPALSGLTLNAAAERVNEVGLVLLSADSARHPEIATGVVFGQDPIPGQLAERGGEVWVVVSSGRELFAVPSVVGLHERDAVALLEASGFEVTVDTVESSEPGGTVIDTDPEGGLRVGLPSRVAVVVSLGPPLVEMPRLLGLGRDEAVRVLDDLGLELDPVEERFRFGLDQDMVIEQEPPPGRAVEVGTRVRLVVGRGRGGRR